MQTYLLYVLNLCEYMVSNNWSILPCTPLKHNNQFCVEIVTNNVKIYNGIVFANNSGVCALQDIRPKLNHKSREITFAHNIRFSSLIVLKFCIKHNSNAVVLCMKFQNDGVTEK